MIKNKITLDRYFKNFKLLMDEYDLKEISKLVKKLNNFKKKNYDIW